MESGVLLGLDKILFNYQEYEEIKSPEDEIPIRPVPDARQRPYHEHIENMSGNGHAIAAKRNIHVVAEEGGEGYVPSSPKIRYRVGNIGVIEVFFVVEAYHKTHTDSHIGISREIKVDLEHITERAQKYSRA